MYAEKKYLVVNEEIFIYIYGGKLRYMDNQGDKFKIIKDINVDDIRHMILKGEIPNSEVKKPSLKEKYSVFKNKIRF